MTAAARQLAAVAALASLAACGPPSPWPEQPAAVVALAAQVAPEAVDLMEPVTITLDLWTRGGAVADFAPELPAADFQVTRADDVPRPLFDGTWRRTTLVARPLRGPGTLAVPSFRAALRDGAGAATTPERAITVRSGLAPDDDDIEAPGEPFPTPASAWPWLLAAGLAAASAGVGLFVARRRRQAPARASVAVPAHVRALRELERLRQGPRATVAEIDAYYVGVSAALRGYLEERFGLRAPERTTEEFLRELEAGDALAAAHRRELEAFLSQCDLVKFAAVVPGEREHEVTWRLAVAFVEATRADAQPATAEAAR